MREDFEKWYISKFLRIMKDAESELSKLRNDFGGYNDPHIDGAWEAFKRQQMSAEITVQASALQAFLFCVSIFSVTGLLWWICFSPSFYSFVMSFCEVCNA